MDKSAMTEAMKTSISEVLGQMFFMPIDFISTDATRPDPESAGASILAKLGFGGSLHGTFLLEIPESLAQSVSADFLGAAPSDLADYDVAGTVLEMVNMLAGGTLSAYDSHALFDLQIPEHISTHDMRALTEQGTDGIMIRIQTLENRMTLQLIIQN